MELRERATRMAVEACADFGRRRVRRSKCRPPRWKTLKIGCCGRGGLRFGHNGVWQGVLFAREPDAV